MPRVFNFAQTRIGRRAHACEDRDSDEPARGPAKPNSTTRRHEKGPPALQHVDKSRKNPMQGPSILQGDSLTRLLQGAAVGAVATMFMGFYWGGWVTAGTAKEMAQKSATVALVAALAPICVDKFQQSAEAVTNMTELKKTSSWQQSSFIEKGGWATFSGSDQANSSVADACAIMLGSLKN
jgi:hypothetical protein